MRSTSASPCRPLPRPGLAPWRRSCSPPTGKEAKEKEPKTEDFTGKVVPLAPLLEKFGAKLDADAAPSWLALSSRRRQDLSAHQGRRLADVLPRQAPPRPADAPDRPAAPGEPDAPGAGGPQRHQGASCTTSITGATSARSAAARRRSATAAAGRWSCARSRSRSSVLASPGGAAECSPGWIGSRGAAGAEPGDHGARSPRTRGAGDGIPNHARSATRSAGSLVLSALGCPGLRCTRSAGSAPPGATFRRPSGATRDGHPALSPSFFPKAVLSRRHNRCSRPTPRTT